MADASSDFVKILPRVTEQPELRDTGSGFSYVTAPDDIFVMPALQHVADDSSTPSMILIEARAAVGKSMLARHLAWQTAAPLWDLAQVYVGSGTLWGSLAKAFGPQQLNSIIGLTLTGQFLLIIDALDEAEMHAGGSAFDAFLIELRDMFAAPRQSPAVVILGRAETIEYVELFLADQVPSRRYRITDFEREQAFKFIDNRLDSGSVAYPTFTRGAQRIRETIYIEARDRLFDFLAGRLLSAHGSPADDTSSAREVVSRSEGWSARTRSFLGYAPVLEAIAEYLASYSADYRVLIADLNMMEQDPYNSGNAQWKMLRAIVHHLLSREQRKVVDQLKKVIPDADKIDWMRVYTPEEQCAHILGKLAGSQELLYVAPDMPDEAKARYRDLLRNALPNHPFLGSFFGYANVVFRDYVHAWGLISASEVAREAVRRELRTDEYLPAPLLGPFVITSNEEFGLATIAGQDFGFVYESLLTQGENRVFIYADSGEDADVVVGNDPSADVAALKVSHPDEGVQFWRRLANADVRGELTVQLGLPGRDFSLGPDVTLDVSIIEVPSRPIRVYTLLRGGGVTINASAGYVNASAGYVEDRVQPELSKVGDGELAIWWDSPRYPWVEFAKPPLVDQTESYERLHEAYMNLSRVARAFNHGSRASRPLWGPIALNNDNSLFHRMQNNAQLRMMFEWLTGQQIIIPGARDYYYLDPVRLREHGISLFEVFSRRETPEALQFVEGFVRYVSCREG
jgi:hypothetical protein